MPPGLRRVPLSGIGSTGRSSREPDLKQNVNLHGSRRRINLLCTNVFQGLRYGDNE
jgi:hypothetical protein